MSRRSRTLRPFVCLLLATLSLVLGATGAQAQRFHWLRGSGLRLTESDLVLHRAVVQDAMENAADGEVRSWENPETGHSGRIRPTTSYERNDMPCRTVQMIIRTPKTHRFEGRSCRVPEGEWKWDF